MRISTTTLESFRLYMEMDWMTEEKLLDSIKGVFVPTPQMMAGSAYHKILEAPDAFRQTDGAYVCEGRRFPSSSVLPALELIDLAGPCELKETKVYRIGGRDVTVVAQVDQLLRSWIIERKTKWSPFDYAGYADSFQWRFYLDIFDGASGVCYQVFCMDEDKDGSYTLGDIHTMRFYPYVGMRTDLTELLEQFLAYVDRRQLAGYLRNKEAA